MDNSNKRRERRTYSHVERERFAELIRLYGARGAREALSRRVCHDTLLKIAAEFGIILKKGRRPASATLTAVRSGKIAA